MMRLLGIVLMVLLATPGRVAAAEVVTFAGDDVMLQGFLYGPPGKAPSPPWWRCTAAPVSTGAMRRSRRAMWIGRSV